MPNPLTTPQLSISNQSARRFLLAYQGLLPLRALTGKEGILALFARLGSIQFDTINMVGRNADLVLQARIRGYSPTHLEELLYRDRLLVDGWDKVACIFQTADWRFFARRRAHNAEYYHWRSQETVALYPELLAAIRQNGPMSSIDFDDDRTTDWHWAETRLVRAALEALYAEGTIGIHHRVNTRRVYDLIENLIPAELLDAPDPNQSDQEYHDWHVLRRIGSMGLVSCRGSEHWQGMVNFGKVPERKAALARLVQAGKVVPVEVEGYTKDLLFLRAQDLAFLEQVEKGAAPAPQAAFIAALDNLIWDRTLINDLFGFEYVWEVYKPVIQRLYGYYVLPILYGDRFVARLDPSFDRKTNTLAILNWWWEDGIQPDAAMQAALQDCLQTFMAYLGAQKVVLGNALKKDKSLQWIRS